MSRASSARQSRDRFVVPPRDDENAGRKSMFLTGIFYKKVRHCDPTKEEKQSHCHINLPVAAAAFNFDSFFNGSSSAPTRE
jgi:hypothetical protein